MTSQTPFEDSDDLIASALARAVVEASDRGLGDLPVRSNLLHVSESVNVAKAAGNLLSKARRAIASGDRSRAERYVDRALTLPFDEMAEAEAALAAANQSLHNVVTEAVERSAAGDTAWLDAAEAALPRCGVHAREDLLEVLRVVVDMYTLERQEVRRIRRLAPGPGLVNGVGDIMLTRAGADRATVREIVFELLDTVNDVERELTARGV